MWLEACVFDYPGGSQPRNKQDSKDTSIQQCNTGSTESTLCLGVGKQAWRGGG